MREQPRQMAERLLEALARCPTINDHSHVIAESERLERDLDALAYFAHPYPAADLQSAGMTAEELAYVTAPGAGTLEERWERFAPHWRHVRWTGFSECLLEGWRATFGITELTAQTVG